MSENQTPPSNEEGIQETFLTHLFELRDRLIKSCLLYTSDAADE